MRSIDNYKLKRVVIREELVELLRCPKKALLLNQFLYWIVRRHDYVQFYKEELMIKADNLLSTDYQGLLEHGWIYKTAEELSSELLLRVSPTTIRRHLKQIIEWGYLFERENPKVKYDKTLHYRINTNKIISDLNAIGFSIDYLLLVDREKHQNHFKNTKHQFNSRKQQSEDIELQNKVSNKHFAAAIPEITSETNPKDTTEEFIKIKNCYLKYSNRENLSQGDVDSIHRVLQFNMVVSDVLNIIKNCFTEGKEIFSFVYIEKVINSKQTNNKDKLSEVKHEANKRDIKSNRTEFRQTSWAARL